MAAVSTPAEDTQEPIVTPEGSLLVGIVLAIVASLISRGRAAAAEYWRNRGYQLTGPGACPQCGDTHRVTKPKL